MTFVIRGTVRDPAGVPVPGARAYFVSGPGPYPDIAAVTNEHGEFALAAPSRGRFGIGCTADGFASEVTSVELPQAENAPVDIRLSPSGRR
jgi:Carboxypeptidase regulatory-like domain